MTATPYVIIDAPSPLGLWESGVERLPEALKAYDLLGRLPARQGARLAPLKYSKDRDPETGFLNGPSIAAY
jgi:arginase